MEQNFKKAILKVETASYKHKTVGFFTYVGGSTALAFLIGVAGAGISTLDFERAGFVSNKAAGTVSTAIEPDLFDVPLFEIVRSDTKPVEDKVVVVNTIQKIPQYILIEEEEEEATNTITVNVIERITIINGDRSQSLDAKLDTGAYRTSVDAKLADKLNLRKTGEYIRVNSASGSSNRELVEITFILVGKTITTQASVADRSSLNYDVIIGRKDMENFLVVP